jgi:serine/threonine protein kinase
VSDVAPTPVVKIKKQRILGTADYMAPEVIKGESANQLLDFWALGVIGFEFLTGYLPFNDETPEKIFTNILEKEIEWPDVGFRDG